MNHSRHFLYVLTTWFFFSFQFELTQLSNYVRILCWSWAKYESQHQWPQQHQQKTGLDHPWRTKSSLGNRPVLNWIRCWTRQMKRQSIRNDAAIKVISFLAKVRAVKANMFVVKRKWTKWNCWWGVMPYVKQHHRLLIRLLPHFILIHQPLLIILAQMNNNNNNNRLLWSSR